MNNRAEFLLIICLCLIINLIVRKGKVPHNSYDEKCETEFLSSNCPHIDEIYPAFFPAEKWPSHQQLIDYENRVVELENYLLHTTGNPFRIYVDQPIGPNGIEIAVFDDSTGFYLEIQNQSFEHIESLIKSIDFKSLNSRQCIPFDHTTKHLNILEIMSGEVSRLYYAESGIDWHIDPTIDSCGRIIFSFFKPDEFVESMAFTNVNIDTLMNAIMDFPIMDLTSKK